MKKNDVFTFTAPNGVEVTAIVVYEMDCTRVNCDIRHHEFLCYAQNRLFSYHWTEGYDSIHNKVDKLFYGEVIVDYCIIPEYDAILENYFHQQDMANDYADKTL